MKHCSTCACGLAPEPSHELPPLPKVDGYDRQVKGHYSATSMHQYAALAVINERRRLSQPPVPALAGWLERTAGKFLDIQTRPTMRGEWVPVYFGATSTKEPEHG